MNMMRKKIFHRDGERGQNFVEIALTLPLLIVLLLGMMEVGFLVHSVSTVATAAREGARFGARGMHIPLDEIADVTKIAMELSLNVDIDSPDANIRIIVTSVDIDPDGSYALQDTYVLGDLDVASEVCFDDPCGAGTIDVDAIAAENAIFSSDAERCNEVTYGCRNDLVIVEVFYAHELKMASPFVDFFVELPVIIDQQSIMRVLIRRSPWS